MKIHSWIILILVSAGAGISPAFSQISTPESREDLLARADRFVVVPSGAHAERFTEAVDPFYVFEAAQAKVEKAEAEKAEARSAAHKIQLTDREILAALADMIRPTGVMQFGENTILLFGERRLSVGGFLSVPYDGRSYQIQLVRADSRTFTLRLNSEIISKRIQ